MNSSGFSDATKPTPAKTERPHHFRLSGSSVKRPYQPRRELHIRPMSFDKELEEITHEPLPSYEFIDEESEDSCKSESTTRSNTCEVVLEEEEHSNEKCPTKVTSVHDTDSFGLAFGALSLETPVKPQPVAPDEARSKVLPTATPVRRPTDNHVLPESAIVNRPDYKFVTPKYNKTLINPKVQCSVNVKTYLPNSVRHVLQKQNTPLPHAIAASTETQRSRKVLQEKLPDNKVQCSIPPVKNLFEEDHTFRRLKVNDVEYIILNLLGRGGSSQVFHCYDLSTKSNRAIKCVSLSNPESKTGYINEVKLLHTLQNCDKIIRMYDYEIRETEKELLVVLEMGGADLAKILKELAANTSHVPLYVLLFYWMEMLYAVKQIHANGIIHSDLKPANFLKAEGGLKLIDFGIATCIQSDMTSVLKTVPEGSFNYISPEAVVIESNNTNSGKPAYKISYKSDVWSLGCILYQLVYRRTPFQHISNIWQKLMVVGNPNHVIEYPSVSWVPSRVINTIKMCLKFEMRSRPSVDELIAEYENIFNNL